MGPRGEDVAVGAIAGDEERWSRLLPELLTDIVRRVDAGAERWPPRRDVVACACVCRRWRDAAVAVVRPPLECGRITFPSSLKQGGVPVPSVKTFQLVAPAGTSDPWGVGDEETVILQFGKIEDDAFTMDFRHPLSAYQAFAICLTSFGTKLACE
uniref:Tubby-like F-box protein n=1 Tax=Aegilops tauschii TaxID=37682 RepID=M8C5F4_AEGTA